MSGESEEAVLRYYSHGEQDPLPVVVEALRRAGRDSQRIGIRFEPSVDPGQVGLDLLMPDFEARMANVGRSITEGRLKLLQAVLQAT
ncbi:MAG: hypothetical protein ACJ760_02180 [Thermoleophilaceae bacterium]